MVNTSFKILRYSLPLSRPLFFQKEKISGREGFILKLIFTGGIQGFGEIAPLPGFSAFGLKECLENLREVCFRLMKENFYADSLGLENDFFVRLDKIFMSPEVRFGIETAVLNAFASQRQVPLSKFLSVDAVDKIVLNGLLSDLNEPWEEELERLLQKGYKLIKVKAEADVYKAIRCIRDVMKAVNNRAEVHVDVNRKWSFEDAVLFTKKIEDYNIKYVEEPFCDISRVEEFFRKTGMPVALDESLVSYGFDPRKPCKGIKFLVLKPSFLGGIRKVLRIIQDARISGIRAIISSSFESGIGLSTLAHLSAAAGEDITAGLDTLKFFREDLLKEPQMISNGSIAVSERNILESDIRAGYLVEI